ncbi:MAG: PKD domain-containing protein [Spirulinaceae cyanobacterium]
MNISFYKHFSTYLVSAATLFVGTTFIPSAQATTLTGFSTSGNQMGGMKVTVNFFNGTSQTSTWQPLGGELGGASGSGWSLNQSGNTYGSFNNPWNFSYTGGSSVAALFIDAVDGNTVFDIVSSNTSSQNTPNSAEGWPFQTSYGTAPSRYGYSVPIDISKGDLFGRLSLFWDSGFSGSMGFLADTDSGKADDPVTARDPIPALPPPPNVAPTAGISIPRINEGQNATAYLSATDPNTDSINFYLNGNYVGTDATTSGTRTLNTNLGFFADNGTVGYTNQVQDSQGAWSAVVAANLIVDNVAPVLTQFDLSAYTINEGESVSAFLSSTDPGADSINFFLNSGYIGTDLNTSGTRSFNHDLGTFADEGIFTYTAKSQDKDGDFSEEIIRNLKVLNVAPTIVSLTSDLEIYQEEFFMFDAVATDPGVNDILTYMWDLDGDGEYNDFLGNSGNWSFTDVGIQTVGLKVTDGDGGEAFSSFNVTVNQVPEPSSILGILALGAGGFLMKRKKNQSSH